MNKVMNNECDLKTSQILCKILYEKLKPHGVFPALTGGTLYKEGSRKDLDILLYRHRQELEHFEIEDLEEVLNECGITVIQHFGWVTKAIWCGYDVDLFNPETKQLDAPTCEDYEG